MRFTGSLAILVACLTSAHGANAPHIKVLIGKSLKDVVVHGTDLRQTLPGKKLERTFRGRQTVNFNCRLGSRVAMPSRPLLIAAVTSPTGLVGWEQRRYRGELHLVAGAQAAQKGCDLVNLVPMETYISSLLAKEMRADWPMEALKAQAVAARSYALAKLPGELPWHLESSEKDQVSGSFFDTTPRTDEAARGTEGEVLVGPNGRPVAGFFHSKCGGKTLRPDQVWSGSVEGYRGVDCPFCHRHGKRGWDQRWEKGAFARLLAKSSAQGRPTRVFPGDALTLVNDANANSELRFYDGNQLKVVRKSWVRNAAGRDFFPSHYFRVVDDGSHVRVQGEGFGHGVGMCQLGAFELARRGYGYRDILQHYFPGLQVKKVW